VLNGPEPVIRVLSDARAEQSEVSTWIKGLIADGMVPTEIGIFVRSSAEIPRARAALDGAGIRYVVLDDRVATVSGSASIGTMHLAKGLEFRAVVVMACDDEILPSKQRIEEIGDDADLEEVYSTERHLLYVACTRARERLLLTGVTPASEFLDDLK
jgi:superfamily I DNA/RNA helicase